MNPAGRVALVTGASSGIGAACAVELARQGVAVAVNFNRRAGGAEEIVAQCRSLGVDAFAVQADVTKSESVRQLMAAVTARFGRLDILVNNAGGGPRRAVLANSEAEFDQIMDLNLKSAFLCTQAALPLLRQGRSPTVINVSSLAGILGSTTGETGVYAAAKAGLNSLTRTLARELAGDGIRVNAVAPGYVDTPLQDEADHRAVFERRVKRVPLGRAACAEEIASLVAFLASDAASYMSAEVVTIGGGL